MPRKALAPIWPPIGMVLCLFALAVFAARAWRSFHSSTPVPVVRTVAWESTEPASFPVAGPGTAGRIGATISLDQLEPKAPGPFAARQVNVEAMIEADQPESASPLTPPSTSAVHVPGPLPPQTPPSTADAHASASPPALSPPSVSVARVPKSSPPLPPRPSPPPPTAVVANATDGPEVRGHVPEQSGPASPWPDPQALTSQLAGLSHERSVDWAGGVTAALRRLQASDTLSSPDAARALQELGRLEKEAATIAARLPESQQPGLLRAAYALQRRLDVWSAVHERARREGSKPPGTPDLQPMRQCVREVQSLLEGDRHADAWIAVLHLEELQQAALAENGRTAATRRALARRILDDVDPSRWNDRQREFLEHPKLAALMGQIRGWAAEPVPGERVLETLEAFELTSSAPSRSELADMASRAADSPFIEEAELGTRLNLHYRNANLVFAASEEFLNRLLPEMKTVKEPVRDEILGADVSGRSTTQTEVALRLVPDQRHLRLQLEAQGQVSSETSSEKWPVTVFSRANSAFRARKLMLFDRHGLRFGRAQADVRSHTQMKGLQSDFDAVPLVGSMVRSFARNQQQQQRLQIRSEVEQRVSIRARARLDAEAQKQLTEAQQRFRTKWVEPFRKLELKPVALETRTSDRGIIVRCRLAGSEQLAAYTPRPRPPAGHMVSLQFHESAMNNVLEQLEQDGQRSDLRDLYQRVLDEFGFHEVDVPQDIPKGVSIRFADEDAVRVQFDNDRVSLSLKIAELVSGRRVWRDFTVRAHYQMETSGLEARLARDGIVELIGIRLGLRNQIALRGIFTTVFSRDRALSLINPQVSQHPRLAGLVVCQSTIRDGWIGLALGPPTGREPRIADTSR